MKSHNPYSIVTEFEERVAEFAGSRYAVAVESCSAAIFLSIMYRKSQGFANWRVVIPSHTYPSVPCSLIHAGHKVKFVDAHWEGEYELQPLRIWDSALRFKKGMFTEAMGVLDALQCLSFHVKKHLQIGRGGMILTDNILAHNWLTKARFDGRSPVPLLEDNFTMLGWNFYMQPADAARGIQLFEVMRQKYPDGMEDLKVEDQGYPDLSKFDIYKQ